MINMFSFSLIVLLIIGCTSRNVKPTAKHFERKLKADLEASIAIFEQIVSASFDGFQFDDCSVVGKKNRCVIVEGHKICYEKPSNDNDRGFLIMDGKIIKVYRVDNNVDSCLKSDYDIMDEPKIRVYKIPTSKCLYASFVGYDKEAQGEYSMISYNFFVPLSVNKECLIVTSRDAINQ